MKYHILISVVAIELSVRFLYTGPEDRLPFNVHKFFSVLAMPRSQLSSILD